MKYLVDANILSEPTKPTPDPRLVAWLRANEPGRAHVRLPATKHPHWKYTLCPKLGESEPENKDSPHRRRSPIIQALILFTFNELI
jgi:hypothetical protein